MVLRRIILVTSEAGHYPVNLTGIRARESCSGCANECGFGLRGPAGLTLLDGSSLG